MSKLGAISLLVIVMMVTGGCASQQPGVIYVTATPEGTLVESGGGSFDSVVPDAPPQSALPTQPPTAVPTPSITPTPNPTREAIIDPTEDRIHTVSFGDTLATIAQTYGVTVESIQEANNIPNPNLLAVGQQLTIPLGIATYGPDVKIIPDSELVFGPNAGTFDVERYLSTSGSFLATYTENLNGRLWSGAEIIERVASEQSVNPRLLLALLEYENSWLTRATLSEDAARYPLNYLEKPDQIYGLYRQLDWGAKQLQLGYYGWRQRGLSATVLGDGTRVGLDPTLNAGTAGLQVMLAQTRSLERWQFAVGYEGLYSTYVFLFGDPFERAVEPLIPQDLEQPEMALPWAEDETWYYTGGPHGGWGSGSAWAALDFVPVAEAQGCELPNEYARAVADGVIAVSTYGVVILDLDGDGNPGTGWTVFYLHLATEGRAVREGQRVQTGDPIGLASCEGGVSFASHLHIARRYNGEWIAADCTECPLTVPAPQFNMEGWLVFTFNSEYDGSMVRGDAYREACVCREPFNTFTTADRR